MRVIDTILRIPQDMWMFVSGSTASLYRMGERIYETFQYKRDKIPIYEIQHDGTIKRFWDYPGNIENRAYDLEHNHKNQIFMKGYSNALDVSVEDIETGEVKLHPSNEYDIYMNQKVLSDSMLAGSNALTTVKYLTMANLAMITIAILIGVSLAT